MPWHSKALRRECATSPARLQVVQTYLLVRMHQQALASACERFHMSGPRLARLVLMRQARARSDRFNVTHEGMCASRHKVASGGAARFLDNSIVVRARVPWPRSGVWWTRHRPHGFA